MTALRAVAVLFAIGLTSAPILADGQMQGGFHMRTLPALPVANGRPDWTLGIGEVPFARGAMSVIATEAGALETWRLVPCREGRAVCAWSVTGAAGRIERADGTWIISGLFGNRTFELRPAGGGVIRYANGATVPLAWNAVE